MKNIYQGLEVSHAEIIIEAEKNTVRSNEVVLSFLNELADSFDATEIFDMIAYVDTPDVLG